MEDTKNKKPKKIAKLYFRSAGLNASSKATRIRIYENADKNPLSTPKVSIMAERPCHMKAICQDLQIAQPKVDIHSAHRKFITKFKVYFLL